MKTRKNSLQRYGMVIGLRPDQVNRYKKLHAAVWPEVLKMIKKCRIQNYSIYLHRTGPKTYCLFSYFEYTGGNFQADMGKMAADPVTQKWWSCCKPCQKPVRYRAQGEWWAALEEVFHLD
jgi:L-rhamnose mutarotase